MNPAQLRLARENFGLSQSQFARLLRVPKSWVVKREQGRYRASASDVALYQAVQHMRTHGVLMEWVSESWIIDRKEKEH